jgi:hypothetical protein
MEIEAHSDRAPKNTSIVIFFPKLICRVIMTCTGNNMSARSVSILNTPILSQKEVLGRLASSDGKDIASSLPD